MKPLRASLTTIGVALGLCCASVWASPFDDGNKAISASFSPYVQKSAQHSETDAGLEVDLGSRIGFAAPNEVPSIFWVSRLRGNMPANKEQNSRRLQTIKFGPQWSEKLPLGRVWVGASGGLETNGTKAGRQKVTGLSTGLYMPGLFTRNDPFQIEVQHGMVTPLEDPTRLATTGNLSPYQRWEMEVNYRVGLGNAWVPAATVGYRHFQQHALSSTDPSKGKNHLATLRFQLPQQFFVQYDRGNMPLDTYQGKQDTAWRLGWEYQLR